MLTFGDLLWGDCAPTPWMFLKVMLLTGWPLCGASCTSCLPLGNISFYDKLFESTRMFHYIQPVIVDKFPLLADLTQCENEWSCTPHNAHMSSVLSSGCSLELISHYLFSFYTGHKQGWVYWKRYHAHRKVWYLKTHSIEPVANDAVVEVGALQLMGCRFDPQWCQVIFIRFYFIHFSRLNSISIILFWENTGSASKNYQIFKISNHSWER